MSGGGSDPGAAAEDPGLGGASVERILVLGATSLIGGYLLPRLADLQRPVLALSRRPQAPEPGVFWIHGDLSAAEDLEIGAVDLVFCLAPIWVLPPLAERLAAAGARRVVAFSSTSRFTKERSPEPSERATARRLAEAEASVREAFSRRGVALTLLRPTLVYAEGRDGNVTRLARMIRSLGFLPLLGSGRGLRQPVHAEDLAEAALRVAGRPETFGRVYDLPGGETLSYREMAERVFRALGRRPLLIALPPIVWTALFRLARPFLPGATAAMGLRMAEDLVFDADPARRDFGWAPRAFRPRFPPGVQAGSKA